MSMKPPSTRNFDRIDAWLVTTSIIASAAIALVHCGSDPVCGNGVQESGEACDKGVMNGAENSGCSTSCQIAALNVAGLQIFVTDLKDEAMGYSGASCSDLHGAQYHVVLDGPQPLDQMWDCASMNSTTLPDVTEGDYKATVTLLGSGGVPLTKMVTSPTVTAVKGKKVNISVNFAFTDFLPSAMYTGTLYFTPNWGADSTSCTMASPQVTGYGVILKDSAGAAVSGMTTGMRMLDGTEAACFVPGGTSGIAEGVADLPWGHYTLTFTGYAGATIAYCKSFDVFNGPGTTSLPYALVIPTSDVDAGACP